MNMDELVTKSLANSDLQKEALQIIYAEPAGTTPTHEEVVTILEAVGILALSKDLIDEPVMRQGIFDHLNQLDNFRLRRCWRAIRSLPSKHLENLGETLLKLSPSLSFLDPEEDLNQERFREICDILGTRDRYTFIEQGIFWLFEENWQWPMEIQVSINKFDDCLRECHWYLLFLPEEDREGALAWMPPRFWSLFPWWSKGLHLDRDFFETLTGCKMIESIFPQSWEFLCGSHRVTKAIGGDFEYLKSKELMTPGFNPKEKEEEKDND